MLQDPEHDTDVFNADGMAPLHLAARGGHMGAAAFLLQRGSFVDMQDWDVSCPASLSTLVFCLSKCELMVLCLMVCVTGHARQPDS